MMDQALICSVCHVAVMREHPTDPTALKCSICGFTQQTQRKPNSFSFYPPEEKPITKPKPE